jgi:hypothetical protein
MPLTHGPEDMAADERTIAKGYEKTFGMLAVAIVGMAGAAWWGDIEVVIAAGVILLAYLLLQIEARLYDLCIRHRRTNALLRAERSPPHHP